MKKIIILGILWVLVLSVCASAQIKLKDVPDDHWAKDAVYDLVRLGVTQGYPDGTYRGTKTINRYEVAVFLSKLAKAVAGTGAAGQVGLSESEIKKIVADEFASKKIEKVGAAVSGVAYFRLQKTLSSSDAADFDLDRLYLTVKNDIGQNAKARVTYDLSRATGDGRLSAYLKYAYVDLAKVAELGGLTLNGRIGLQPTYWIGFVDDVLGIRYVTKSLTDIQSVLSSADFGVGANGSLDLAGLKVKYDGALINGSGYKAAETNTDKAVNLRVNAEVMDGLTLAAGAQVDFGTAGLNTWVANGLASYKLEQGTIMAEGLYARGSRLGLSLGGIASLGTLAEVLNGYKAFGRFDYYDPSSVASDQTTRIIAGASYDWVKNVQIAANVVNTKVGNAAATNSVEFRSQYSF